MNLLPKHSAKGKDEMGAALSSQCMKLNLEADPWGERREEISQPVRAIRFRLLSLKKSQKFKKSNLFLTRGLFKDQHFLSICANIQNSCYSLTGGPWGRCSPSDMPGYFKWCDVCCVEPAGSFTAPPRARHGLLSAVQ